LSGRLTGLVCLGALGGVWLLTACGSQAAELSTPEPQPELRNLVLETSDLPAGWALVPGERRRVPLAWVLRDPWSAGYRAQIRRQRVAGFETSFWSPEHHRIECEAAVYRSSRGARTVYALRARSFGAFASQQGGTIAIRPIGDASSAYRLVGRWKGFIVAWRYGDVLARCSAADLRDAVALARLQQRRVARALG
jgi:hypothetical protein